ncbi:MAG: flippase [Candidatus Nanoarchaeia archaeon]
MKKITQYSESINTILKGGGITFIISIFGYLLTLIIRILSARYFGPEEYGLYEMCFTIFSIFVMLAGLGIMNGTSIFIPDYVQKKKYGKLRGYLNFLFTTQIISASIMMLIGIFFAKYFISIFNFDEIFIKMVQIICVFIPFKVMSITFASIFRAKKRMLLAEIGDKVIEKALLLVGIILIVTTNLSMTHFVLFLGISMFINFLIYLGIYLRERPFKEITPVPAVSSHKDWLAFSVPLLFIGIFGFIIGWADNFVISIFLNSTYLGLYSVAYSFGYYIFYIQTVIIGIFIPILVETRAKSNKNFLKIFCVIRNWVFGLSVFLAMILIFFSKQIVVVFFGGEYAGAGPALSILSVFFLLSVYFSFYGYILLIKKDTRFIFYCQLIFAAINILLNVILIQKFNIVGVAFASGVTLLMLNVVQYIRANNKTKGIPKDIMYNFKFLIAGFSSVLLSKLIFNILLNKLFVSPIPKLIIGLGAYSIIFFIILLLLKTFRKEDAILIEGLERKLGINLNLFRRLIKL